jgi:hypothetical protein
VIIYCLSKLKKSQTTSQKHLGSAPATKSIAIASDSVFASLVELSGAMMNRINAPISTTTELNTLPSSRSTKLVFIAINAG